MEGGNSLADGAVEQGEIKLENIQFTYPTKQEIQVLSDVSIEVGKNKTIALVGSSGCGKSTVIQLVERFYDPLGGQVSYGQQNLKSVDPVDYKAYLAIV